MGDFTFFRIYPYRATLERRPVPPLVALSVLLSTGAVIDKNINRQVFSGDTDSAGQIDVTLSQGSYDVVVQGQSKSVNLNKDQEVSFSLNSAERPTG
jgi:hypothetical protein